MLITFITVSLLTALGIAYWLLRHLRTRRNMTAVRVCANREESDRAICWQSMLTLAELLRFEHPDADEPKQVHRRLVRHIQSSRTATSDHAEVTIDMLEMLCDISSHQLRQDHADARGRMLDAASEWRETLNARRTAEQALRSSRKLSSSTASEPVRSKSETAVRS